MDNNPSRYPAGQDGAVEQLLPELELQRTAELELLGRLETEAGLDSGAATIRTKLQTPDPQTGQPPPDLETVANLFADERRGLALSEVNRSFELDGLSAVARAVGDIASLRTILSLRGPEDPGLNLILERVQSRVDTVTEKVPETTLYALQTFYLEAHQAIDQAAPGQPA